MKNFKSLWHIILLAVILILPEVLIGQGMIDPVSFKITKIPDRVQAGASFEVVVKARLDGNWHLYSINNDPDAGPYPTKITLLSDKLELTGKIKESKPVIEYDPNFDAKLGWHKRQGLFTIPLKFIDTVSGKSSIKLQFFYQTCNDKICLPPRKKSVSATINVAKASQSNVTAYSIKAGKESSANSSEKKGQAGQATKGAPPAYAGTGGQGIFSFLWIALTAGFLALLTPCVFPMIPLTVAFFSKQSKSQGRQGIDKAIIFGLAIIATFTILGVVLALLIGTSGANRFASNPWVNIFIGSILFVFAVSLLGAFELRLPHRFTNWLNRKSNESSGFIGILFMSFTISAVSFSCTAPFVGGILAATAGGQWFHPIVGMIAFSAAFASPFVLFAMFPGWLESLPKSGSWMNLVKALLGFIELAAAIKFISNADLVWGWQLISRPFAIAIWIAIFLLAGLYTLGFFALKHETKPKQIGTTRLLLAIPFLLFSFYLIPGLLGASLGIWDAWLPPKNATDVSVVYSIAQTGGGITPHETDIWSADYQKALAKAKEKEQLIFIDFTGYTCTNCRAMEANVFPVAGVQKSFNKMKLVRIYTDDGENGPENQKFQFELTGTIALPTYAIINPNSGTVISQLSGYTDKATFQQFLEKGLQIFHQSKS